MTPQPVVIIPWQEYESVKAENRFHAAWPGRTRTGALAFSEAFEPSRADEWGHIAYCIGVAIDAMKEDAR